MMDLEIDEAIAVLREALNAELEDGTPDYSTRLSAVKLIIEVAQPLITLDFTGTNS